ncbi:hypothetical protein ABZ744_20665 [Micromonospora chersina]|uniref:hypothetical protein n=1 Tax=Micromonospora chersina TaxID=47854 RepID=UPI003403B454
MTTSVHQARPADVPAVTAPLVDALCLDPVAEWLVPDTEQRPDVLHRLLAVDVDHAIETGYVDVTGDWSAAAVWRRHDLNAQQWALGDYHLTTFAGRTAPRFDELNAAMHSYRSDAVSPGARPGVGPNGQPRADNGARTVVTSVMGGAAVGRAVVARPSGWGR